MSVLLTYVQYYSYYNDTDRSADNTNPIITKTPTISSPVITEAGSDELPNGWVYKGDGQCGVMIPVPPQTEPYIAPYDPERPPSVTEDKGSGRYWDYGRGVFWPDLLTLLPNGEANYQQSAITYASPDEASGYISATVVVSCIPNTGSYNNEQALSLLKERINNYNMDTSDKGMRPSTYEIISAIQGTRWGQNVIDIDINGTNGVYMFFTTPKYIYEIRSFGESTDSFTRETADKILMNLKFN
ncbi:hypothetical protein HGA91_01530 [candidate division WWE3 bacterium]|nr:hypothetical protein [candidate division WWE3 bacterium]